MQFAGPVREAWKAGLRASGARIVEYVPDFAFRVVMTPAQAERVAGIGSVRWVGGFQAAWKLSRAAKAEIDSGKPGVYRVKGQDGAAVRKAAQAAGAVVSKGTDGTLLLAATPDQVRQIAVNEDVLSVDTAEGSGSTAWDKLELQALDTSGNVLGTLGTVSNVDANSSYVQKSYDLAAYKGQTIRLRWLMSEDYSLQTTFAVDDAAVMVN